MPRGSSTHPGVPERGSSRSAGTCRSMPTTEPGSGTGPPSTSGSSVGDERAHGDPQVSAGRGDLPRRCRDRSWILPTEGRRPSCRSSVEFLIAGVLTGPERRRTDHIHHVRRQRPGGYRTAERLRGRRRPRRACCNSQTGRTEAEHRHEDSLTPPGCPHRSRLAYSWVARWSDSTS